MWKKRKNSKNEKRKSKGTGKGVACDLKITCCSMKATEGEFLRQKEKFF
jgi:hypothetical protein